MLEKADINILLINILGDANLIENWWNTPIDGLWRMTPNAAWSTGARELVTKIAIQYLNPDYT